MYTIGSATMIFFYLLESSNFFKPLSLSLFVEWVKTSPLIWPCTKKPDIAHNGKLHQDFVLSKTVVVLAWYFEPTFTVSSSVQSFLQHARFSVDHCRNRGIFLTRCDMEILPGPIVIMTRDAARSITGSSAPFGPMNCEAL